MRLRLPRSVASFVVCSTALLFLYVIAMELTPTTGLYADLPTYGQRIGDIVDGVQQKIQGMEADSYRIFVPTRRRIEEEERQRQAAKARKNSKAPTIRLLPPLPSPRRSPGRPFRITFRSTSTPSIKFCYGVVHSLPGVFMLSWRDHINRSFLQLFQGEARVVASRSLEGIAEMVRAFVVGNFLLGLLLAIVSSAMFWADGSSVSFIGGPLSGLLSLVPYVGLPLAMLPPLFAALGRTRVGIRAGNRVGGHTASLALTCCIPKWSDLGPPESAGRDFLPDALGLLWDAPGLLLAIPLTAGLKAVCDNVKELRPIGKFLGD